MRYYSEVKTMRRNYFYAEGTRRVYEHVKTHRATTLTHMRRRLGMDRRYADNRVRFLYRSGFVNRSPLKIMRSQIYYHGDDIWEAFKRSYILPKNAKRFIRLMKKRRVVTDMHLIYDHKYTRQDIYFIRDFIAKRAKFCKWERHERTDIFYIEDSDKEKFLKSREMARIKKLESKSQKEKQQAGDHLEIVVGKLYKKLGYKLARHKYFKDRVNGGRPFYVDFYGVSPMKEPTIIECKNKLFAVGAGDILRTIIYAKNIFGPDWESKCRIHIFGMSGISHYLWNPQHMEYSLLKAFPNIRVFDFYGLRKMLKENRVPIFLERTAGSGQAAQAA